MNYIKELFRKHGYEVNEIEEVSTGKFNNTFIGKLDGKRDKLIIRIAPDDESGFLFYEKKMMAREPEIHRIVRENSSIPIPEIVVYDDSRDIIDRDFLIMEYIPGLPLSDVQLATNDRNNIMRVTGKHLRQLHESCKNNGFGYPGENCMSLQSNWQDAFYIMWNKLIDDIRDCGVYQKKEADLARSILDNYLSLFDYSHPASLLHMDIWSQNIMIKGNKLSGIIDWDRALWGHQEIEFAVLDYCGFNNESFWQGYGFNPFKDSSEFKIRQLFYHLYEVQKYLVIWTLRTGERERVKGYRAYSLEKLQELA